MQIQDAHLPETTQNIILSIYALFHSTVDIIESSGTLGVQLEYFLQTFRNNLLPPIFRVLFNSRSP
jgi:hypothetical protein